MNKSKITLKSMVAAMSLVACAGLISPQLAVGQTPAAPSSAAPFVLTLSTGFQKVISLPGIPARVSIGDPTIASVTVLKPTDRGGKNAGVLVTGLKTGDQYARIFGHRFENRFDIPVDLGPWCQHGPGDHCGCHWQSR